MELDYEQPGWTWPQAGGVLTLVSDNIPEDRKRIEEAGAKVLGEADQPWGHMLTFEDFDSNVLILMHAKY
jgi:predicted enzyme related to lactoylglutathione lyase